MSLQEATISNMWEIAAIVELLEQKGICIKQDLHTIIDELRRKNPRARIPEARVSMSPTYSTSRLGWPQAARECGLIVVVKATLSLSSAAESATQPDPPAPRIRAA
jgi:hypothetical protein